MLVRRCYPLITTIREKCRACYTCVRECPAKAIKISTGQAEVLGERCIGCGNCFRVCSQNAKKVYSSIPEVRNMLGIGQPVSAMLAPSFPAAFGDINYRRIVGMVRALGFATVHEVGFGADLVAHQYHKLLKSSSRQFIATTCPALVEFVTRFHPALVEFLAPIVSPMLAMARVLRQLYGSERKVVFIGPCIAKKAENDPERFNEINGVLTFIELQEMFDESGICPAMVLETEFDEPRARLGALFPISRGILQAANVKEDLMDGEVVAADGRHNFVEAIKELESGALDARMLEILCCYGCIMGPGIQNDYPLFRRRSLVSRYVQEQAKSWDRQSIEEQNVKIEPSIIKESEPKVNQDADRQTPQQWMEQFNDLDLTRKFITHQQTMSMPSEEAIKAALRSMGKELPTDELNCGACGYELCRSHAEAIVLGLAESEMCLPYTIDQLRKAQAKLQTALSQSEKMASMGQLSAAIAHEINNPLGIVLMYAHMLHDECPPNHSMRDELKTIVEQTDRCKRIVAGLLNFARQKKVTYQPVNIEELIERCLKTILIPAEVKVAFNSEIEDPVAELDGDQLIQVIVNLVNNACEAMPNGGELTVTAKGDPHHVILSISDTGCGIPDKNQRKIFEPFFTTKPVGRGTGLGLAVSYGIIKMHRGDINITSNTNQSDGPTGTTFTITLPRMNKRS